MNMDQILSDWREKKAQKLHSKDEEKQLILETLQTLKFMTELFCGEVSDVMIHISEREGLEWDAGLRRFVYHQGETSQFLELARKEVLFRVRPFFQDLLEMARDGLD